MADQDRNTFLNNWSNLTKVQKILVLAIICLSVTLLGLSIATALLITRPDLRLKKCPPHYRRMPYQDRDVDDLRLVKYKDIINDNTTTIVEEFEKIKKFIVSIHYKLPNGTDVAYCVGSILNRKFFMTSSICIHKRLVRENLYVRAGSVYYNKGGTVHKFGNITTIPDWRSTSTDYYTYRYIAVVQVDDDFSIDEMTLSTVKLPRQDRERFLPNYKLYTAGWGTYISMKVKPKYKTLQVVVVQMYDASIACKDYLQKDEILALKIIENILCAGDLKALSKDQCNIDAGAPLTHLGFIAGVSWSGMSCKNYPTVYTKVSLYSNWTSVVTNI